MDEQIAMAMGLAMMATLANRKRKASRSPEILAVEDEERKHREAEAKLAEDQREQEEMERAPRAYRTRQMKARSSSASTKEGL